MHQAALLGGAIKDSKKFGWELDEEKGTVQVNSVSYVLLLCAIVDKLYYVQC